MRKGDEELEVAAGRCAGLVAKRHRLLSGFTSLEKPDIAFLLAADFAQRRPKNGGGPGDNQQLGA